jgi:hypothetical protein
LDTERPLSSSIHADEPERVTDPGRSPGRGPLVEGLGGAEGSPVTEGSGVTTGVALVAAVGVSLATAFGEAVVPGARTTNRIAVTAMMATIASMARDASPRGTERGWRAACRGTRRRELASLSSCSK